MTDEQFTKLLPIAGTVISVIGGLTLNYINERREKIRKSQQDNDAQAFVNRIAETQQDKIDALERRIEMLESEGRDKDSRIAEQDRHIETLMRRIDQLTSANDKEKEINLDTDMG